jgi:predicted PurR-regulated permease PerM
MMKPHIGELVFFWILFGGAGLLFFAVMSPYILPIFLAGVFTILFSPLHLRSQRWVKGNDTLAALGTVMVVLCLILIPLILLGFLMSQEVVSIYNALSQRSGDFAFLDRATRAIEQDIQNIIPSFELHSSVYNYLEVLLRWVGENLNSFLSSALSFISQLLLVLIAMFFFYRYGEKFHDFVVKWIPLSDSYDESIITKLELAVASVVKGSLSTAILQGSLLGLGFALFGVPNPVLWGVVATVTSLIPVVGTGVVLLPAVAFLFIGGDLFATFGLLLWGIFLVGLIDNVTRPLFMRRGIDIHPFLIFLSVLGGLAYFGPIGFLAGPIILAFFFALLDIYPDIVKGRAIDGEGVS